ncbi:hypothetical protein [Cohnella terricola]|uniref:Uncharacterized protein n=1 Tax=Cohnella terricola TaxID=1289167 RepID=A0A559J5M4_9BACL|nr:hypothetical protein [Cohnella terricola]TVX95180.1 hypothetical protein FPZ45_23860 [Cohnella terricola]
MRIIGIEGMTAQEIADEVQQGGKFVFYYFCFSVLVLTFKRPSDIYFIRAREKGRGAQFTVLSILFGWWGISWGPIHTIGSLITNFSGGKDVTEEVMDSIAQQDAS